MKSFHNRCYNLYESYRQVGFERYGCHSDLIRILESLSIKRIQLGNSIEQRSINCLCLGHGPIKILAWSQMHGDESTATGALLDCINFFMSKDDCFDKERAYILERVSLYFIPMLNPDGAENWQRCNALGIDLNRDALRSICPESKLLHAAFEHIKPDYAFNLHDQESYYTAGNTDIPASISLLAPPPSSDICPDTALNITKPNNITVTYKKAIKMVCALNKMLQEYIPGGVGKWSDEYEPRAFGEHFQMSGVTTVLIETGGYPGDPLREMGRRLNFTALIYAFNAIACKELDKTEPSSYNTIPLNQKGRLFDLILRNASVKKNDYQFRCDLGYRKTVSKQNNEIKEKWNLEDMGDLSCFAGYNEQDLSNTDCLSSEQLGDSDFIDQLNRQ